jgi:hypothetical protein
MTLDDTILAEAKDVRERLLDLQHEEERAQADYHHAIRRLQAAGGSLREIAAELGLSHQRVHQIVGSEAAVDGPRRNQRRAAHVRLTRVARGVVAAAGDEARALGHARIGTEHLLLASLAIEESGSHRVLAEAGVEVAKVRDALAASLGRGESVRRRLPFTRAAKRALEQAVAEAAQLGSRLVGSEHLLLGLIAADGSGARELLESLGADVAALRERTLALLTA